MDPMNQHNQNLSDDFNVSPEYDSRVVDSVMAQWFKEVEQLSPMEISRHLHMHHVKRRRRIFQGFCALVISGEGTLMLMNYIVTWLGRPIGIPAAVASIGCLLYLVVSPFFKEK
jgi:hypothetical protein